MTTKNFSIFSMAFILLSLLLIFASCRSSWEMHEYFFDQHKPYEEIGYEQLPESTRAFHDRCHTPNDIEEIYCGHLEDSGKKVYGINFRDGSEMIFDKNGRCIRMDNWRYGLPECWTNQIPLYNVLHMAIRLQMAELNPDSKPWNVRCLEFHPKGYLVKAGIGLTIYQFYFDKNGKLKDVAIEI